MILAIDPWLLIPPKDYSQLPTVSGGRSSIRHLGIRS